MEPLPSHLAAVSAGTARSVLRWERGEERRCCPRPLCSTRVPPTRQNPCEGTQPPQHSLPAGMVPLSPRFCYAGRRQCCVHRLCCWLRIQLLIALLCEAAGTGLGMETVPGQ